MNSALRCAAIRQAFEPGWGQRYNKVDIAIHSSALLAGVLCILRSTLPRPPGTFNCCQLASIVAHFVVSNHLILMVPGDQVPERSVLLELMGA